MFKRGEKKKKVTFSGVYPYVENFGELLCSVTQKPGKKCTAWILVLWNWVCSFSWPSHFGSGKHINVCSSFSEPMQLSWVVLLKSVTYHSVYLLGSELPLKMWSWLGIPKPVVSGDFCLAISQANVRHITNNVGAYFEWSQNISWSYHFWNVLRWLAESRPKSSLECFLVGWWEADWNK